MSVPANQIYIPNGVDPQALIDPALRNAEYTSIQNAFNGLNAWDIVHPVTSMQLTSGTTNVLVDLTLIPGNIVLSLPQAPSIGNPVVAVAIDTGSPGSAVVVTTSDGSPVMGTTPNVGNGYVDQPVLAVAGDILFFQYVNDIIGWRVWGTLHVVTGASAAQGAYPYKRGMIDVPGFAVIDLSAICNVGDWCQVKRNANSALSVSVGNVNQTFNGAAGPFALPDTTRYTFINVGANTFIVVN